MCTLLGICAEISREKSGNWRGWTGLIVFVVSLPFFAGADNVIFERLAPGQDDLRQTTLDHLDVSHLLQATYKEMKTPLAHFETWNHCTVTCQTY